MRRGLGESEGTTHEETQRAIRVEKRFGDGLWKHVEALNSIL